jgi:hypothetical protein
LSEITMPVRAAGDREAGAACPHCQQTVQQAAAVLVCPTCASVHHAACWAANPHCGSYICAPGRRDLSRTQEPALVISSADLDRAPPLPTRPAFATVPPAATPPTRTSRLAVASLICALAGIPLFGVLTGLVAIVMGSLALGTIHSTRQKGIVWASAGVLLGLGDVVGWVVFLFLFLWRPAPSVHIDFQPDLTALENLDPKINRAMRANVLIESPSGWGGLAGTAIGSGVILKIAGGDAIVITNRHVVDAAFSADEPAKAGGDPDHALLKVHLVDQSVQPGSVIWLAPGGIDLALVRIALPKRREIQAAPWQVGRARVPVGDPVFAIGNPQGLGWTHTQGAVSQYRIQKIAGRQVPVIQTQTVINPGNSGGGLYDRDGFLVGINTWTQDKRVSEGLNFAIALEILTDLRPPELGLPKGDEEPDRP